MAVYYKHMHQGGRISHTATYYANGGIPEEDYLNALKFSGDSGLDTFNAFNASFADPTVAGFNTTIFNQIIPVSAFYYNRVFHGTMFFWLGDVPIPANECITDIQLRFVYHNVNDLGLGIVKSRIGEEAATFDPSTFAGNGWDQSLDPADDYPSKYSSMGNSVDHDSGVVTNLTNSAGNSSYIDEYGTDGFIPYFGPVPSATVHDPYISYNYFPSSLGDGDVATVDLNATAVEDANRDGFINLTLIGINIFASIYEGTFSANTAGNVAQSTGIRYQQIIDQGVLAVDDVNFYGSPSTYDQIIDNGIGYVNPTPALRITTGPKYSNKFKGKIYSTHIMNHGNSAYDEVSEYIRKTDYKLTKPYL